MNLESLLEYLDGYLEVTGHPDYPTALNGLQVQGDEEVRRICTAVDASQTAVDAAAARGAQLLLVHHGIFWGGLRPLTGPRHRKISALVRANLGLYSVHLPLDRHAEIGNGVLLGRALGADLRGRFAPYQGVQIGWWGELDTTRTELAARAERILGGAVRVLATGPEEVRRVGILTGAGGSAIEEAARIGLDTLVTGEGAHHVAIDAAELGLNVLYGGHYATETFGIRALGDHLSERFPLDHTFLDLPTGT